MTIKKIFLFSFATLSLTTVWAQNPTEIKEKDELIGDISGNALYVNVYRAEEKNNHQTVKIRIKR